jgi:hypothetical protein
MIGRKDQATMEGTGEVTPEEEEGTEAATPAIDDDVEGSVNAALHDSDDDA